VTIIYTQTRFKGRSHLEMLSQDLGSWCGGVSKTREVW